jgi:hypothetical protein
VSKSTGGFLCQYGVFVKNMSAPEKNQFIARIASLDDANAVVKQTAYGLWAVAAFQGAVGFFLNRSMLFDATCYAVLATVLLRWKSRIAALLLLLLSGVVLTVTLLNKFGVVQFGGTNIVLAAIIAYSSVRAVEATFKIHGRLKEPGL